MGGSISAVWENTVGTLRSDKDGKDERVVPGHVRLGLRRARDKLVQGRGRSLLPTLQDEQFDADDPVETTFADRLQQREAFGPNTQNDTKTAKRRPDTNDRPLVGGSVSDETETPKKTKKVKRFYHKTQRNADQAGTYKKHLLSVQQNKASLRGNRTSHPLLRAGSMHHDDPEDEPPAEHTPSRGRALYTNGFFKTAANYEEDRDEERAQRERKERAEMNQKRHALEKRRKEAHGCRGRYDDYCMVLLLLLYSIVAVWSFAMYVKLNAEDESSQYDPATDSYFIKTCNVSRGKLLLWWRYNYVWLLCMAGLVVAMEVLYWFVAPYSPYVGLTTFAKGFVRSVVFVVWLVLVVVWAVFGSTLFWTADPSRCGNENVEHARGLLVTQYVWLIAHLICFLSNFDNKNALRRMWCFTQDVDTTLIVLYNKKADVKAPSENDEGSDESLTDGSITSDSL